jgi:hypothetical protein
VLARLRPRADKTTVGRAASIAGIVSLVSGLVTCTFETVGVPPAALATGIVCALATVAADAVGVVALIANRDRASARRGLALAAAPTLVLGSYGLFVAAVVAGGGYS